MDAKVPAEAAEGGDSLAQKISAEREEDGATCLFLSINTLSSPPSLRTKQAKLQPSEEKRIHCFPTKN